MLSISLEFKWLCIEEWQWGFIFVKFPLEGGGGGPSQKSPPPVCAPDFIECAEVRF